MNEPGTLSLSRPHLSGPGHHGKSRGAKNLGTGRNLELQGSVGINDPRFARWWGRFERLLASRQSMAEIGAVLRLIDVRSVLPHIQAPTLILQRTGDQIVPSAQNRFVADQIPGARYVELPGSAHIPFLEDADAIVDEIEESLTGARPAPLSERVLATVLFTDVVGSTQKAAELGVRRWRELLDEHHWIVRAELGRFRGREIGTSGDGFLATFDGPARGVRCGVAIRDGVRSAGIPIRAGPHTGEIELMDHDIGGIAVHIGSLMASTAEAGQILVSSTVRDLVAGSGIRFADRGKHALKGVPDAWRPFAVEGV